MSPLTNTFRRSTQETPHNAPSKMGPRRGRRALRYGIGGVAATAALALGVSPAMASTACTYDPGTRAVTLVGESGPAPTELITSGSTIRFTSGSFGASCQGGGVVATPANTEKITVKGTNPSGFNHFIVPVVSFGGTNEPFDAHSEIETSVLPGSGGDLVDVKGTGFDDTVHITAASRPRFAGTRFPPATATSPSLSRRPVTPGFGSTAARARTPSPGSARFWPRRPAASWPCQAP
jgi:hypothetical protein